MDKILFGKYARPLLQIVYELRITTKRHRPINVKFCQLAVSGYFAFETIQTLTEW